MDSINIALEKETVFHFLNGMMAEFLDEYLAYEIKIKQVKDHHDPIGKLRLTLEQQGFIQGVRKVVLLRFMESLDNPNALLTKLTNLSEEESVLERARFMYRNDRLAESAMLLGTIPAEPERDFILASIALQRGDVSEGKAGIERIVADNPDYKPRVDSLYRKMLEQWMTESHLQSFRKICIDRAKILCPEDESVDSLRNTWLKTRTMELMNSGAMHRALDELKVEEQFSPVNEPVLNMIMAFQLFMENNTDEGMGYMIRSLDGGIATPEMSMVIGRFRDFYGHGDLFDPEQKWMHRLLDVAVERERPDGAGRLFQDIIRHNTGSYNSLVFQREISEEQLGDMEAIIERWMDYRNILPEWWMLKALCELAHDRLDAALENIDRAIDISEHRMSSFQGAGYPRFMKGILYLSKDNVTLAIGELRDLNAASGYQSNTQGLLKGMLHVKSGSVEYAGAALAEVFERTDMSLLEQRFAKAFSDNTLIVDICETDGLHAFSAWYFLNGRYMIDVGMIGDGFRYLRASVNIDQN
jgi:tetratricopeptide (TPR) repeat protein